MKFSGYTDSLKPQNKNIPFFITSVFFSPFLRLLYSTIALLLNVRFLALGVSYYTLSNGSWSNTTTVWSTNSASACSCAPSPNIDGFNVIIRHVITMNDDIYIKSGNSLTINVNSELSGTYNLYVENGDLNSNGSIVIGGMTVKAHGRTTFYGPVTASNNFILEGITTFKALITVTNANLVNKAGALVLFSPGAQIKLLNGNLTNTGTIDLDSSCAKMDDGNFENLAGGSITGIGLINVLSGNIVNTGTWGAGVDWCASGTGSGISFAQNCNSDKCSANAPLPIELVYFEGHLEEEQVILSWQTSSESNNEYYTIERSLRGWGHAIPTRWEEIRRLEGAGNSNSAKNYKLVDDLSGLSSQFSTLYYRLKQTDYDGKYKYSNIVAIKMPSLIDFSVHPNPTPDKFTVQIHLAETEFILLEVFDLFGHRVFKEEVTFIPGNTLKQVDLSEYARGVYSVRLQHSATNAICKRLVLQ